MRLNIIPGILVAGVLAASVYGQSLSDPPPADWRLAGPPPIEQDYFRADVDSGAAAAVLLVEERYLGRRAVDALRDAEYDQLVADVYYSLDYVTNHPTALSLLGALAHLTNDASLPIARFEAAIRRYPQHSVTQAQYGLYLLSIGSAREAIPVLKKAIELDAELPHVHAFLAAAYRTTGATELGRQAEQRARDLGYRKPIPSGF